MIFNEAIFAEHGMLFEGVTRHVGNLREENLLRARFLYEQNPKITLGFSGGIDSQITYLSFLEQDIPVECVFMHYPGYNDNEYNNIKKFKERYPMQLEVFEVDPYQLKDKILELGAQHKIHPHQMLHQHLVSLIDRDRLYVQGVEAPLLIPIEGIFYYWESPQWHEWGRKRALEMLERPGKEVLWDKNSEMTLCFMRDPIYQAFMKAGDYFQFNGILHHGQKVSKLSYWDLYVKPIFFHHYYKNELIYFPKNQGPENIDFLMQMRTPEVLKRYAKIPVSQLIKDLETPGLHTYQYKESNE